MKTSLLILFLLLTGINMQAQEKFIGTIEYEVKDVEEHEDDPFGPTKIMIIRNPEKIMLKMFFKEKDAEQWLLVNTLNDSFYRINPRRKDYMIRSLNDEHDPDPALVRTDSVRNIMGYKCYAYRVTGQDHTSEGYSWIAEDLGGLNKEYPRNANMNLFGGKHVMLAADIFEEGKLTAALTAVSIKKMDRIPDSLFDISGFKSIAAPIDETYGTPDSTVLYSIDTLAVKPPVKKLPKKKTPAKKVRVKTKAAAIKPKH